MEIKVGKFTICSDPMNLWINEDVKRMNHATGEKTEVTVKVAGYCQTFEEFRKSFIQKKINTSAVS